MILLHLGALHPVEKILTLVLAFGPFLVLAVVVVVRRRQDRAAELADSATGGSTGSTQAEADQLER